MKTYYEVLGVAASATPDEIKRTFRREISKYHPDKVQHLGHEFQEMAATIAAELTEAYRVLMDPAMRANYDAELEATTGRPPEPPPAPRGKPPSSETPRPAQEPARAPHSGAAHVSSAGIELVRKATLARLRSAVDAVLGADAVAAPGFDAGFVVRGRKALFRKNEPAIRLLVRLVPQVDAEAVAQVWSHGVAAAAPGTIVSVILLGYGMASPKALSRAITEQRHITQQHGPIVIPVDVRDWEALLPADTPALLRLLLERLRTNNV